MVEDEAVVRELAESYLTFLGYNVLVATNGAEAFELCLKQKAPVHLVLSGRGDAGDERPRPGAPADPDFPEIKWIFMSGYTKDTDPAIVLGKEVPFVQKPFQPMELGRLLRTVLDT